MVLVVTACPAGLRGQLTRWLLEISPGVFVGRASTRVRDLLWSRVVELARNGRAILVFSARNEQRLDFRVHDSEWEPVDFDGVHLMRRPAPAASRAGGMRRISQGPDWSDGWSDAALSTAERTDQEQGGISGRESSSSGWSSVSRRRKAARMRAARLRGDLGQNGGQPDAQK